MTLIEMLVVMSIIALLMAFLVVGVAGLRKRAQEDATRQTIRYLAVAAEQFKEAWGVYPPDRIEAVLALIGGGIVDIDLATAGVQLPEGYYSDSDADDNEGIKALYIALACPMNGGPFIGSGEIRTREIGTEHIYYVRRPTICEPVGGGPGTCDTTAQGDDIQVIANTVACNEGDVLIDAGPNGRIDTDPLGGNDVVVFDDPEPIKAFQDSWGKDLRYDRGDMAGDNAEVDSPNPRDVSGTMTVFGSGDSHMLRNRASFDLWSMGANGTDECVDAFSAICEPTGAGNGTPDTGPLADDDTWYDGSIVGWPGGVGVYAGQILVLCGSDNELDTVPGDDDVRTALDRDLWDGDDGDDVTNWELSIYENR